MSGRRLVLDASVVAKAFIQDEEHSERARNLIARDNWLSVDLLIPKCANVFWTKQMREEWTSDQAMAACDVLGSSGVELIASRRPLFRAVQIAIPLNHAAYDGFYLAAAELSDAMLVTSDRRLLNKLASIKDDLPWEVCALEDFSETP